MPFVDLNLTLARYLFTLLNQLWSVESKASILNLTSHKFPATHQWEGISNRESAQLATLRPNPPFEPVYPAIRLHPQKDCKYDQQLRQKFDDSVFSPQFEVQVSATHFLGKLLGPLWHSNFFGRNLEIQFGSEIVLVDH